MSSRPENKKACSAPRKSRNQPCDNRPRSGPAAAKQRTPRNTDAIRADLPDEPPTLTPEAAWALMRIFIKAFDRLNGTGNPKEPLNDQVRVLRPGLHRRLPRRRVLTAVATRLRAVSARVKTGSGPHLVIATDPRAWDCKNNGVTPDQGDT